MDFDGVKRKARERFNEVQVLLNFISSSESQNTTTPVSLELKIMKGLFYVHLYAAFEKTINETVETALSLISSKNIKNNHLSPTLLSIVFLDEMKSLKDGNHSNILIKSSKIFSESTSANIVSINETTFEGHLQNVWAKTINEVSAILGINDFSFTPRVAATINEIVQKRNAIAHGRDSASSIGERYRANVLREKMEIISSAVQEFIMAVEEHCAEKKYIKPTQRRYY